MHNKEVKNKENITKYMIIVLLNNRILKMKKKVKIVNNNLNWINN